MARFLQGLTLAALLGAQPKPFSHRLHLKLKPDCVSCHAAVPASSAATDNLLPQGEICRPCHASVSIKQPSTTLVSRFSHKLHGALGNLAPVIRAAIDGKSYLSDPGDARRHLERAVACGACHRGMEESGQVTRAAHPQMADCLVCHTKIDPPFSCSTCHDPAANLKPATHTRDYLESHSSRNKKEPLDRATCAVCHGRTFTCLGCH